MALTPKLTVAALVMWSGAALAHGDVAPQPVNTDALPEIGDEWLLENPYRAAEPDVWAKAIEIGASGYNQNCARCHGLQAVSGGLAPDLRYLEADEFGDEWYLERYLNGYTQNGITKMPAFGELLGQKAAWAIKTYIETRPDDGALDDHADRLAEIRDRLGEIAEAGSDDGEIEALREELEAIAVEVPTGSGAPIADSAASQALAALSDGVAGAALANERLTIGLSAAQ